MSLLANATPLGNLNDSTFLNVVFSFLGGGLMVAIFNWVKEVRSVGRQREIAALRESLTLYGPLHFFVTANAQICVLHQSLTRTAHSVIDAQYVARNLSESSAEIEAVNKVA